MSEYLFVYGTLRPNLAPAEVAGLVRRLLRIGAASAPGRIYDPGAYPGAILDPNCDTKIIGEVFQLPDDAETLAAVDVYEGFDPHDLKMSLFVRRKCEVTLEGDAKLECWIYVYNRQVASTTLITSGDYLWHRKQK